jgi:hypothetical protein
MKATLRNAVAPSIPRAMITDNATNDYDEFVRLVQSSSFSLPV